LLDTHQYAKFIKVVVKSELLSGNLANKYVGTPHCKISKCSFC